MQVLNLGVNNYRLVADPSRHSRPFLGPRITGTITDRTVAMITTTTTTTTTVMVMSIRAV